MASNNVVYLVAVEYLSDGKWHDKERVLRRLMDAVPPGKAAAVAENRRIMQHRKVYGDTPLTPRRGNADMEKIIRAGARELARAVLGNKSRFEFNEDRSMVRLVPQEVIRERAKNTHADPSKPWRTRLLKQGINPDEHVTHAEFKRQRSAAMAAWTPEQWDAYHKTNSLKSWAARKANEEKEKDD